MKTGTIDKITKKQKVTIEDLAKQGFTVSEVGTALDLSQHQMVSILEDEKRSRREIREYHEKFAEAQFAAYELTDSEKFDRRQKARNILRYQMRGYCFELPPVCARYGKACFHCTHLKCRENEQYDGLKWDYDFDPDINRFSSLFDNLQNLATKETADDSRQTAGNVAVERSMSSLIIALAEEMINTAV